MISFVLNRFVLTQNGSIPPAQQYDNETIPVRVTGDIPTGWGWELLLAHGEHLDIAHMDESEDGLVVVLTAEQLAFNGYYTAQLRATQGEKVKHSTPVLFAVGRTLSGDEHWPEIPTEFTQALQRAEAAIETAREIEATVERAKSDAEAAAEASATSAGASAQSAEDAAREAADAAISAEAAQTAADSMSFVSFSMDENGHLILQRSERLGTTSFRLRGDGNLEVII